jgi:hypothetical protein
MSAVSRLISLQAWQDMSAEAALSANTMFDRNGLERIYKIIHAPVEEGIAAGNMIR